MTNRRRGRKPRAIGQPSMSLHGVSLHGQPVVRALRSRPNGPNLAGGPCQPVSPLCGARHTRRDALDCLVVARRKGSANDCHETGGSPSYFRPSQIRRGARSQRGSERAKGPGRLVRASGCDQGDTAGKANGSTSAEGGPEEDPAGPLPIPAGSVQKASENHVMDPAVGRLIGDRNNARPTHPSAHGAGHGSLFRRVPGGTSRKSEPLRDAAGGPGRPNRGSTRAQPHDGQRSPPSRR